MVTTLLTVLAVIVVGGVLIWLLDQAPIDATIKTWGRWLMLVVIVIVLITTLLPLVGLKV